MTILTPRERQSRQLQAQQAKQATHGYSVLQQWQQEGSGDPVPPNPPAPPNDPPLGPGGESALKAERERARKLESELKALQETFKNIDPNKYAELESASKKAAELEALADQKLAKMQAEYDGKLSEAEKKAQGQVADLKRHTEATIKTALLQSAYTQSWASPERMAAFLRGWADDFKLEYPEGELPSLGNAKLIPVKDGKPVYVQNADKETLPQSAHEYIAKNKAGDFGIFFDAAGGGTGTYTNGQGYPNFSKPPASASEAWDRLNQSR